MPGSTERLALDAATAVTRLRSLDLTKPPGIAEAIDWVAALAVLGADRLDPQYVAQTWGSLLKNRDDLDLALARGADWLAGK
ncbi:hypothetical protein [Cryobacterium breve]|uniref:hypothetical protein n=1 Tax=Cryobacterium breve TaxID=1259258 RepID=UPI00248BBE96|nr:hypothetical protein [Cryobacterium breve]